MQQKMKKAIEAMGKVGFIGAGKVGFTLGKYFSEHKAELSGYFSRRASSAKEAAAFTGSKQYKEIKELVFDSDILFLTVPDKEIGPVWEEVRTCACDLTGKLICHASGSLSTKVFQGADASGAEFLSLHPLFAISDKYDSYRKLKNAVFTIEGVPGDYRDCIRNFIMACGNKVEQIDAGYKPLYHEAAVVASNFVVGLAYLSSRLLMHCGFSKEGADCALLPLMEGSMSNIIHQGMIKSLTGPVERNDCDTIRMHLQTLDMLKYSFPAKVEPIAENQKGKDALRGAGETALDVDCVIQIYREMTRLLIDIGEQKHSEIDYSMMRDLVWTNRANESE